MKELFKVDFKDLFRGLFLSIIGTTLAFCLLFISYGLVFNLITSNPGKVKGILERSNLYADLPAVLYDQLANTTDRENSEVSLKDTKVREIALDVYNPAFVQSNIEKLVDGVYGWLEGNTAEPEVTINFTSQNKKFASKLGNYAKKKATKLPVCNINQIQSKQDFDIFRAKCLPADITPESIRSDFKKLSRDKDSPVLEAKFNAKDIKTDEGEPLYKNLNGLPQAFSFAKSVPLILMVFSIMLVLLIFYISKDRFSAFKRISGVFFFTGVFIVLTPVIVSFISKVLMKNIDDGAGSIVRSLLEEFMRDASRIYYVMGILLIAGGASLYIYAKNTQVDDDKSSKVKS